MKTMLAAVASAGLVCAATGAAAQENAVTSYFEAAFKPLAGQNCGYGVRCTLPIVFVANTRHDAGASTFNSPATGSVRYCSAYANIVGSPTSLRLAVSATGTQLRSETQFKNEGMTCSLLFDLNTSTLQFQGPKAGTVIPTINYNLQVLNGMLVGTANGFTSVIVLGTATSNSLVR